MKMLQYPVEGHRLVHTLKMSNSGRNEILVLNDKRKKVLVSNALRGTRSKRLSHSQRQTHQDTQTKQRNPENQEGMG